jgi:GntR family transcriptional regulator, transcriptional repressor for pyruvate dehydrogenase complex
VRKASVATPASDVPPRLDIVSGESLSRPLKTAEIVARDIVRDMATKRMRSGDPLPPESVMLEQHRVSRESLREGLRLLEVQGLIRIRRGPGGGPIVGQIDPANLGRSSTLYYHLAGATYEELFDAWVMAEATMATRAARHSNAAARRAAMEPYLRPEPLEHPHDLDEFVRLHTGFHAVIARLGDNRVIELTLTSFGQIVSHHMMVRDDPRRMANLLEHDHRAIATAIADGRARQAGQLMEEHIERIVAAHGELSSLDTSDTIEWH